MTTTNIIIISKINNGTDISNTSNAIIELNNTAMIHLRKISSNLFIRYSLLRFANNTYPTLFFSLFHPPCIKKTDQIIIFNLPHVSFFNIISQIPLLLVQLNN